MDILTILIIYILASICGIILILVMFDREGYNKNK